MVDKSARTTILRTVAHIFQLRLAFVPELIPRAPDMLNAAITAKFPLLFLINFPIPTFSVIASGSQAHGSQNDPVASSGRGFEPRLGGVPAGIG
jgi:hypothetical protein